MAEQRERALLAAYIRQAFPAAQVRFNCALGMVPYDLVAQMGRTQALRYYRRLRPTVDAIAIQDHTITLIETKIYRWLDGLAKLPIYGLMAMDTPELEEFAGYKGELQLVIPFAQANILRYAKLLDVQVVEFSIPEIDDYIANVVPRYQTAEWKHSRAARRATLEALGIEV